MDDTLLPGFDGEPSYLAQPGAPFAGAQPKVKVQGGIPQLPAWLTDSKGVCGNAPRDSVLRLIDRYLGVSWASTNAAARITALGELYFLTDHWLKKYLTEGNADARARCPAVFKLFKRVVDELCASREYKVNYLPELIARIWGRTLAPHGRTADTQGVNGSGLPSGVRHLSRGDREKYRLVFQNGLAYQFTWWQPGPYKLVLAESARVGWTGGRAASSPQAIESGFAGFALSMGPETGTAKHHRCAHARDSFDSSYAANDTVLCTGTLSIRRGRVEAIGSGGGNYQPALEHLVNVIQTLLTYGVPPQTIRVRAVANSWARDIDKRGTCRIEIPGDELLKRRASALGMTLAGGMNLENLRGRGCTDCGLGGLFPTVALFPKGVS
jgi:hypothetical protein